MKSITDELININTSLQSEKKSREESESAIFDMLKDVVNRVRIELDSEKKDKYFFIIINIFLKRGNGREFNSSFGRYYK